MPDTPPAQAKDRNESHFPIPPLDKWIKYAWDVAKYWRIDRAVLISIALLIGAVLVPLVAATTLILVGQLSEQHSTLAKMRDWYIRTVQDGFEVLHSRIDYVRDFTYEVGGYQPSRVTVIRDIEQDQYVQIVLHRIRPTTYVTGVPIDNKSKKKSVTCSLVEQDPKIKSEGLLRISVSGIPVTINSLREGENAVPVRLDEAWWRDNKSDVERKKRDGLELLFEVHNFAGRTKPSMCGAVVVEGKVSVYKNGVSTR